ncbi:hypothetical protein FA95DRAFT_1578725, partial [Auriscalpium vulgare]
MAGVSIYSSKGPLAPRKARHTTVSVPSHRRKPRLQTLHFDFPPQPLIDSPPSPELSSSADPAASTSALIDELEDIPASNNIDVYITDEMFGQKKKRKTRLIWRGTNIQVDLFLEWVSVRGEFLDEIIRHDGWGSIDPDSVCPVCNTELASVKCEDCVGQEVICDACCCEAHVLTVQPEMEQLGHDGRSCPCPRNQSTAVTVIDISGVHTLHVRFCDCRNEHTANTYIQFLRAGWWPATVARPRTVTTLRTLELFHAMTIQGKLNAYDFWLGLVKVTDATGLVQPKNHYKDFIRSVRCFRNARACKRAGRAHDPAGINGTTLRELAVECPACPQPGRNMDDGWEDEPDSEQTPSLRRADPTSFQKSPLKRTWKSTKTRSRQVMKACGSSFAAVDLANIPAQKRFAVNGVGAVICARHLFYRKNGVGDLSKGERYCNMDFLFLSTIAGTASSMKRIVLTYDIACQYSKNFMRRMSQFPEAYQIDISETLIIFLIPKFHLLAHGLPCQVGFNLNNTEGMARTCGEGIEAGWSETNGASLSTREMSGDGRREALDDQFGAINWRKLSRSLKVAVAAYFKQHKALEESTATFPAAVIQKWEAMVKAWDADNSKPNHQQKCRTRAKAPMPSRSGQASDGLA